MNTPGAASTEKSIGSRVLAKPAGSLVLGGHVALPSRKIAERPWPSSTRVNDLPSAEVACAMASQVP